MRNRFWAGSMMTALAVLVGCQGDGSASLRTGPSTKVYDYTAYNAQGQAIVQGAMSFDYTTPTKFTGKWRFRQVRPSETAGPQVGNGNLRGELSSGRLTVSLTSNPTEGSVRLTGVRSGDRLDGDWVWNGQTSNPLGRGKFLAQLHE
jgi:hypothetical protein